MSLKRTLVIIDAPSNLGLRPPCKGSVPGCYKMPWMLHDRNILGTLGATYGGVVVPPRYNANWTKGNGDRNAEEIAHYSRRLSERVHDTIVSEAFPLVIGGDCSILIGNALALKKLGRYGLIFIDAHSDYRHPGNSESIGAAAGEDLAIVTGNGDARLVNLQGMLPYIRKEDVLVLGILSSDEDIPEMRSDGISVITNSDFAYSKEVIAILDGIQQRTSGYWIHLDFDSIDQKEMSAVDCPESTGTSFEKAAEVVRELVRRDECSGMEITIYDPDLDPDGIQCDRIAHFLRTVLN